MESRGALSGGGVECGVGGLVDGADGQYRTFYRQNVNVSILSIYLGSLAISLIALLSIFKSYRLRALGKVRSRGILSPSSPFPEPRLLCLLFQKLRQRRSPVTVKFTCIEIYYHVLFTLTANLSPQFITLHLLHAIPYLGLSPTSSPTQSSTITYRPENHAQQLLNSIPSSTSRSFQTSN